MGDGFHPLSRVYRAEALGAKPKDLTRKLKPSKRTVQAFRLRREASGLRVQGLGCSSFEALGLWCGLKGSGLGIKARVQGSGLPVEALGLKLQDVGFRGLGFKL